MKFFLWFVAATIVFVLVARFKPHTPTGEGIVPTQAREAQGRHGADETAPPARTEEQGQQDALRKEGGNTY